ncbi:MAG: hypothetical protein IJ773_02765 [Lachnospiraceae bacterium]|nr:hypothetical protein [Lachnospiraceae bacterium]
MTGDDLKREFRYEALMHQAKRMLHAGLITEQKFQEIEARFRTKNKPISGGYIVQTDLLCARRRVINGCGKEMAQHFMLVCQIMTTAIDTVPKARLCH